MSASRHDRQRDRIAANWLNLPSFVCAGCMEEKTFPKDAAVVAEASYGGGLRADIALLGIDGHVEGIVEVIDHHGPSPRTLEEQSKLAFAYYRLLNVRKPPKRHNVADEISRGRFRYSNNGHNESDNPVWLCSPDCLEFFEHLKGADRTNAWDAPRCDVCRQYLHDNPLSQAEFRGWAYALIRLFASTAQRVAIRRRCNGGHLANWLVATQENGRPEIELIRPSCFWRSAMQLFGSRCGRAGSPN